MQGVQDNRAAVLPMCYRSREGIAEPAGRVGEGEILDVRQRRPDRHATVDRALDQLAAEEGGDVVAPFSQPFGPPSRKPFAAQTSLIKARLMAGTALASDETGMRVGKANWWLWVFHHRDSAVFVADNHRSKAVVEAFLGDWRPDYWISDTAG